jgi:hypothetical protein
MARSVATEAIGVGIILVIIFALIHVSMMAVSPKAMEHSGIFLGVFLAGVIGHLFLEETGGNKKFCDYAYGEQEKAV